MTDGMDVTPATSEDTSPKKPYTRPMIVEIGATKDVVQSYYTYNPNDGYQRYYVYRS